MNIVVIALVKLENLKANHNTDMKPQWLTSVVIALVKLENLKANHNRVTIVSALSALLLH